jgi:hypothetical protein
MPTVSAGTDKTANPDAHHGNKLERIFNMPSSDRGGKSSVKPVLMPRFAVKGFCAR